MKSEHLAKITSNARALVCRHRHLAWRLSLGDLEQEALLAQVDASTRFDAERGTPFGAFTFRAAVIAVYRHVLTDSAPVSGRHNPEVLIGLHREQYIETCHESDQQSPDALFEREERAHQVRSRLTTLMGDENGALFVTQMLTGEFKPGDVAEEHDLDVSDVYKAVREAKKRISGDPELYELWRNL